MEFRLEFTPKGFEKKINHQDKLFLCGSCFTEQIGSKLRHHKFRTIDNPNGILFNPVSIATAIDSYIDNKRYTETDLFYFNELWGSWNHHTRFSDTDKSACLQKINESQSVAHDFLQQSDWLLLTLGSAFVYEQENGNVVANCHKVPTDKFTKKLLDVQKVLSVLEKTISRLKQFNPGLKVIFTISPVRHLREGFVENNRSKAVLINAVHELVASFENVYYFPAYELVIDDLRDYRFYAEDMVHPNYAATNYVWEKFINACIDDPSKNLMKEIAVVNAAKSHKPFNPHSIQHQKFLEQNFIKLSDLLVRAPYIDFSDEMKYFKV